MLSLLFSTSVSAIFLWMIQWFEKFWTNEFLLAIEKIWMKWVTKQEFLFVLVGKFTRKILVQEVNNLIVYKILCHFGFWRKNQGTVLIQTFLLVHCACSSLRVCKKCPLSRSENSGKREVNLGPWGNLQGKKNVAKFKGSKYNIFSSKFSWS